MRKLVAEDWRADDLEEDLTSRGYGHLRVRHHGDTLTIESGAKGPNAFAHARLRRETVHLWRLEMPTSTGRWATTAFGDDADSRHHRQPHRDPPVGVFVGARKATYDRRDSAACR